MRQEAKIIPHPAVRRAPEHLHPHSPVARSPASAVILVLFAGLVIAGATFAVHRDLGLAIIRENGPVEMATVFFYAAAGLLMLLAAHRGAGRTGLLCAFFMAVFALRELDFHYRFTARGIEQKYFYTDPEIGLVPKVVVVLVLAVVAAALVALVVRGIAILRDARRGQSYAVTALAGIALLPLSPVLDRVHYHVTDRLGRAADSGLAFAVIVLEETLELLIPALFLVATAHWIWREDRKQGRDRR